MVCVGRIPFARELQGTAKRYAWWWWWWWWWWWSSWSWCLTRVIVIEKPPFEINETGWGEFECIIEIHFKDPKYRPVSLFHLLKLHPFDQSPNGPEIVTSEPVLYERYDELVGSWRGTWVWCGPARFFP